MDLRELKALELAARMRVVRDGKFWSVPSQTGSAKYRVDPVARTCTCEDYSLRQLRCKHQRAVELVIERESGNEAAIPTPEPDAEPYTKRPTYKQNWRAPPSSAQRVTASRNRRCRAVS